MFVCFFLRENCLGIAKTEAKEADHETEINNEELFLHFGIGLVWPVG